MSSTVEKWKNEFNRWETSGLTRAEYCRQNNIKLSTFDYWRHLYWTRDFGQHP